MARPDDVKRALRALALGTAMSECRRRPHDTQPSLRSSSRRIVEDAVRSLDSVAEAAAFCEAVGLDALRRAVDEAERCDGRETIESGRRALATFERYRRAATPDEDGRVQRWNEPNESNGARR